MERNDGIYFFDIDTVDTVSRNISNYIVSKTYNNSLNLKKSLEEKHKMLSTTFTLNIC